MKYIATIFIISMLTFLLFTQCGNLGSVNALSLNGKQFKTAEVADPTNGMPLLSINIPQEWSVNANTEWDSQNAIVSTELRCVSPDGQEGFTIYKPQINNALQILPVLDLNMFIEKIVMPSYSQRQNVNIVAKGSIPLNINLNLPGTKTYAEIDSVIIEYTNNGNKFTDVICSQNLTTHYSTNMFSTTAYCIGLFGYTQHTSTPEEAMKNFTNILMSIRYNPEWQQKSAQFIAYNVERNNQYTRQYTQNHINNMNNRYAATQSYVNSMQQIGQQNLQTFNNANDVNSRVINGWTDVFTDRQNTTNSYTGETYKVSNQYNNTWNSSQGGTYQTNSNFDPNSDPALNSGGTTWEKDE